MADRHSEVVHETSHLELALNASQATLASAEREGNVARAQLEESGTRVAGKIPRRTLLPSIIFTSPLFFL